MTKNLLLMLLVFAATFLSSVAQQTVSFTANGSFTVPAGVTSVDVLAKGTRGGNNGGGGGIVSATLTVTPGEVLLIKIADRGGNGFSSSNYGGGATDIRTSEDISTRILVAGGGGGKTVEGVGGAGGGLTGGNGTGPAGTNSAGQGGTQSAGGAGGIGTVNGNGGNGGLGTGGNASASAGGGGGAGYYGGGGGAYGTGTSGGAGGGGSSYTDPTRCTNVVHTQGGNNGAGSLVITYTPPPANDLCSNAQLITAVMAGTSICGTTVGAGADEPNGAGVECGNSADNFAPGVWYTFTGDGKTWQFNFPATEEWDPEINVYYGTCAALTCAGGDDDSGGGDFGTSAAFSIATTIGTTYYVYVHKSDSEMPDSPFCFTFSVPAPKINLRGNGITIVDGDTSPDATDNTNMGSVTTGGTISKDFVIQNTGTANFSIDNITFTGANGGEFTVVPAPDFSFQVAAGKSETITVRFAPTTAGERLATMTLFSSTADIAEYDIALKGTGTTPPPDPANDLCIDAQLLTSDMAGTTITGTTVNAEADTPEGSEDCGTRNDGRGVWYKLVGDGKTWNFNVPDLYKLDEPPIINWDPAINVYSGTCANLTCVGGDDDSGGGMEGTAAVFSFPTTVGTTYFIRIHHSNPTTVAPFSFSFSVTTPTVPELNLQGNSITIVNGDTSPDAADNTDMGSVATGGTITKDFVIQNTGTVDFYVNNIEFSGDNGTEFTVVPAPDFSFRVSAGSSETITVQFAPTATGERLSTMTISYSLTVEGEQTYYTVALKGMGTAPGPTAPEINVQGIGIDIVDGDTTPNEDDGTAFRPTLLGNPRATNFDIQNTGTSVLVITNIKLNGENAADFTLDPYGDFPLQVAPGETIYVTVGFDPKRAGEYFATLTISSNDADEAEYDFRLKGTGVDPLNSRYSDAFHGNFTIIGNTLGQDVTSGVPAPVVGTVGSAGTDTDDTSPDVFWRSDFPANGQAQANTSITSSEARSTAVLSLPAGAVVKKALVYWSGRSVYEPYGSTNATLERPGTFTQSLTSDHLYTSGGNRYNAVKDVTALVQANGNGAYRMAGMDLMEIVNTDNRGLYAGWSMVVVYELGSEAYRFIEIRDGLRSINGESSMTQPFLVPTGIAGDVRLGVVGFEGDDTETGDVLLVNDNPLTNDLNPEGNFFNSSRSTNGTAVSVTGDLPQLTGTANSMSGIDMDILDLARNSFFSPEALSYDVQAPGSYDTYYLGVLVSAATTQEAPSPKINLQGNGITITDGDITPITADNTDMGSVVSGSSVTKQFVIQNTGTANFYVNNITFTGENHSKFTLFPTPDFSFKIAGGGSETISVRFAPTTTGEHLATMNIFSDADVTEYNILLKGTGTPACATPTAFAVTGGGPYCVGGNGPVIGLADSQTGVSYQLKKGDTNIGDPVAGTGDAISFGPQTQPGTYIVVATAYIVNDFINTPVVASTAGTAPANLAGGGCSATMTGSVTITVSAASIGGNVAGTTAVCSGNNSTLLTLSNHTGSVLKWQSASNLSFSGAITINNTTTSLTVTNVTQTTYYRAVVKSGECSEANSSVATISLLAPPTITLGINGQTLNEGNTQTLCDTDANPVNSLQFTVNSSCASGPLQWRVQIGAGAWSAWSTTAPSTQPSDNVAYHYQAACGGGCLSAATGPISLTINYRASTPQNVSLVADGTTVAVGQSATICDVAGNTLTFNATCAAGEIRVYSVDGGEYSATVPTQMVDGNFHNYHVRCRKADATPSCAETESAVLSLKITPAPAAPVVSITPAANCTNAAPAVFSGNATCGSLTTIWYNALTNQALATLPSTTPTVTTSYYARCQNTAGCQGEKSNTVTFTVVPLTEAPVVSVSAELVCTGTQVTVSTTCPAGSSVLWNTGITEASFQVAFNNITRQSYVARCVANSCQSPASAAKVVSWKGFELTFINVGSSQSGIKPGSGVPKSAWSSQFITPDAGPALDYSTQANPTIFHSENLNKTAPRFWTIHAETCNLGTNGSLTFDMLATPEVGIIRSYNTHENNAPYLMYANRDGFTELYAQNHPLYGFFADNGSGGNTYDAGLPKGLYKLGVRYWDQKGQGSIYPATRQPAGNVLAYQEYWFRIQSKNGVGNGAARLATDNGQLITDNRSFAQVMPNPVSNTLRLKVNEAKEQPVKINLTDASGRVMLQRNFIPETNQHQEEFEVSHLVTGMYFLRVNTIDKQATLKVIKVQ